MGSFLALFVQDLTGNLWGLNLSQLQGGGGGGGGDPTGDVESSARQLEVRISGFHVCFRVYSLASRFC